MNNLLLIILLCFSLSAEESALEEEYEMIEPLDEEEEEAYCPSAREEGFFVESGILFMKAGQ